MFTIQNTAPVPRRLQLRRDDLWKFQLRRGGSLPIQCVQGSIWITREGSPRDVVLPAGERYQVDGKGLVVVSAIRDAIVCVGG
jgi:hypothetical protein